MPHHVPFAPHAPDCEQDEQTARRVLDSCIEKLCTSTVGDSRWLEACQLLGQIDPAFVPMQIEALADEDDFVREWAAHAPGAIGPTAADAVQALTEALLDNEPCVRQAACEALQSL